LQESSGPRAIPIPFAGEFKAQRGSHLIRSTLRKRAQLRGTEGFCILPAQE
jgi:hypothetical protein